MTGRRGGGSLGQGPGCIQGGGSRNRDRGGGQDWSRDGDRGLERGIDLDLEVE